MEEPLRVAICEDTRSDADRLIEILNSSRIPTEYTLFESAEALLDVYHPQMFDLLLTDIYMQGMNGVEAVARIRETDENLPVAFVTTSTDHALEGYRLSVLKYIEKPYCSKDIESMLQLAKMERDSAPSLLIRKSGREERIRLSRIICLEQRTHQLTVSLSDGSSVQVYEKLSELMPQLSEQNFFQPHKSYAINLEYARFIDTELKCFVMQGGKNIPIRRESMVQAKQAMKGYLFSKTRGGGS